MLARLADRLILKPSTYPIPTDDKARRVVRWDGEEIEVWTQRVGATSRGSDGETDVFVLKFPGTAGRAERATEHPAECWEDCRTELWTVNPLGYGGSTGRASLRQVAPTARAVWTQLNRHAGGRPILVTGNSLGSLSALYLAAHFDVDGVLLRNPPPLRQLIVGRHGWWTLGVGAWALARQVPDELCAIRNAAAATAPALFLMSGKDRLVHPRYQRRIMDKYAGEHRVLVLSDADHASPLDEGQQRQYGQRLQWLRQRALAWHQLRPTRRPCSSPQTDSQFPSIHHAGEP
jgi:pimeloyl-ACP methyl ester carboxylesterase